MRWEWQVGEQLVSAELSLTGHEKIAVDGVPVFNKLSLKLRNEVPLSLQRGEARVLVSIGWALFPRCVLLLGDQEVPPLRGSGADARVPGWASLFIGACAIIPVVTLGGALPGVIGIGSALACHQVATSRRRTLAKVWLSIVITVAAWILLGLIRSAFDG